MPLIEEASKNVSDKLFMSYEDAFRIISDLIEGSDSATRFFFLRSLCNQVNLTDCKYRYLSLEEKQVLLGWYLGRHESLCLGDEYIPYEERAYYMSKRHYDKLDHSSLYLYIQNTKEEGSNFSSDCLFPREDMSQCSDFQKIWQSISSYWIINGHKKVDPRKIPSFLALSFNVNPSDSRYRYFMSSVSNEDLKSAILYAPTLNRNMSWSKYKSGPISAPLPCVSPLGFDYMAFVVFDYLDTVRTLSLWSS